MMGISRTRSAGAKVTDEEYAQLEALAQKRGLTLGEWCRDVLLSQLKPSVASLPEETILAEVLGLRMIMINLLRDLGNGETPDPGEGLKGYPVGRHGEAYDSGGVPDGQSSEAKLLVVFATVLVC